MVGLITTRRGERLAPSNDLTKLRASVLGLLDRLFSKTSPAATPPEQRRDRTGRASAAKADSPVRGGAPSGSRDNGEGSSSAGAPRRRRRRRGGRGRRADGAPGDRSRDAQASPPRADTRTDSRSETSSGTQAARPADERPPAARERRPSGRRRGRGRGPTNAGNPVGNGAPNAATAKALASGGYNLSDVAALDQISPDDYSPEFREMGLSDRALAIVASLGFETPTPIQAETIPLMLRGDDVVGQAQTGTGKTLAFGLPIVEHADPTLPQVQAIVLVPTRELAQQVFGVIEFLAAAMGLQSTMLMGGRRLAQDFDALERRPQIVVGTPGRIIDHLQRRTLSLDHVRVAVLDEADRMLDIGFEPDMRRILSRCPKDRRTALYSATIPTAIKTLIWRYMDDPVHIQIEPEQRTAREIAQRYYEVAEQDKLDALQELLPEMTGQTLVFCNMKVTVDRLVRRLQDRRVPAEAIHGDLDQRKRDRVMQRFRNGDLQMLVATNVASRGLDIPDVSHVLNFDVPQNADEYVHRVGRTGRAGREGSAITFVGEWDLENFEAIQKAVGDQLERAELTLYAR